MSQFFEKMSKIDKPLARLREKREDSKSEMKKEMLQRIMQKHKRPKRLM